MTKYAYEDLSSSQFERLIVCICHELFGIATQGFAAGPDGGRDAKFTGTANNFPSNSSPWSGTVIIQAKHVNSANRSCSENDFYGNKSSVIAEEIPRIQNLKNSNELEHYILFTNRRLSADAQNTITSAICEACQISRDSVHLAGVDDVEGYLKRYPDAAIYADINPIDSPLIVSSYDLADIVERFDNQFPEIQKSQLTPPIHRTHYAAKNQINNMSEQFADDIKRKYLPQTQLIDEFLANAENRDLLEKYKNVLSEFQLNIISKRKDYDSFDEVMTYLHRLLINRDPILKSKSRLTWLLLFYMYWNCDIGESENAQTNQTQSP